MITSMLSVAPQHRYSLYPSFGDFYFDPKMPISNPYRGGHSQLCGPRPSDTRETARPFWNQAGLDTALDHPDILHSEQFLDASSTDFEPADHTLIRPRLHGSILTPTTEPNRVGCFEGVFLLVDSIGLGGGDFRILPRAHYLKLFPHFPRVTASASYTPASPV